jgi:hypothetical protein
MINHFTAKIMLNLVMQILNLLSLKAINKKSKVKSQIKLKKHKILQLQLHSKNHPNHIQINLHHPKIRNPKQILVN